MDHFVRLPDHVIIHILDLVSDVHTLIRLKTLSHRFNSLVLKTQHLFLRVKESLRFDEPEWQPTNYLSQVLGRFDHVTKLVIETPTCDDDRIGFLPHEGQLMYKATFGDKLKSCVILMYGAKCFYEDRYKEYPWQFWMFYAFFESSRRHVDIALRLTRCLKHLVSLVVKDSGGVREVVMDEKGLRECRERYDTKIDMRKIRYRIRMNLDGYINIGGLLRHGTLASMVYVGDHHCARFDDSEEAELARRAFGSGIHGMAIEKLFRNKAYLQEDGEIPTTKWKRWKEFLL